MLQTVDAGRLSLSAYRGIAPGGSRPRDGTSVGHSADNGQAAAPFQKLRHAEHRYSRNR